ncbi:MAG: helix-turn-helix domain-containing protein [Silvibacterium sp.]
MSMTYFASQADFSAVRTEAWRRIFGMMIQKTRQATGRSLEESARLAGMESSEWAAVESGYIPADPSRLRSMAAALEIRFEQMATMVFICQSAWKG